MRSRLPFSFQCQSNEKSRCRVIRGRSLFLSDDFSYLCCVNSIWQDVCEKPAIALVDRRYRHFRNKINELTMNKLHSTFTAQGSCSGDQRKTRVIRLRSTQADFSLELAIYILKSILLYSCNLIFQIYKFADYNAHYIKHKKQSLAALRSAMADILKFLCSYLGPNYGCHGSTESSIYLLRYL